MNLETDQATAESYRHTRRLLLIAADKLTVKMGELEAETGKKGVTGMAWSELDRQRRLVIEMLASCSYIIEWLETGRMPGNRRGIERRAGYQREIPIDPSILSAVLEERREPAISDVPGGECGAASLALERALGGLTERERDCYRLSQAEGFTLAEVADVLKISKSSAGTYLLRARRKIETNLREGGGSSVG
ncbi:sigma factor-like helix-turn-helix DNA-binding protein [Cohnella hashimotonis]|uniref:Sigma factor-like helix-turn-helix DNA-binding protein n=1 Tax=Cohnella hashimotonis TaxID=2826895 RepID=A0ABT6TNT9_9BACL|nr:sigma factor-like helix-turn-helix DNA-binding protein [Cohnella hashimotonis]MDI4648527.1 sigma factor-like helix-turn-helix DNA-binding protein [Cohnella hashimotonis]